MKKSILCQVLFVILLSVCTVTAFAWNNSIELGYGYSHDPNNTKYYNSGFLLSGDLLPIQHTRWSYLSITGALGQWHSSAPNNNDLTTAAVSLALRLYPFTTVHDNSPYLFGSAGPAYLSRLKFGTNTQGSHLAIQSNLGLGVEINCYDVNLRFVHFSNAGLAKPNEGFNFIYLLSFGLLF